MNREVYSSPWLDKFEAQVVVLSEKIWRVIVKLWTYFYEKVIRDVIYRVLIRDIFFEKFFRKIFGIRGPVVSFFETDLQEEKRAVIVYRLARWLAGQAAPFVWRWFADFWKIARGAFVVLFKEIPLLGYNMLKRMIFVFNIPINLTTTFAALIFTIVFVFIDRNHARNLKYPKTYEPNIGLRLLMFTYHLLVLNRFMIPYMEYAFRDDFWWIQIGPYVNGFFTECEQLSRIIIAKLPININTTMTNDSVANLYKGGGFVDVIGNLAFFGWIYTRSIVQLNLKRKIKFLVLSMFMRYHLNAIAAISLIQSLIDGLVSQVGDIDKVLGFRTWPEQVVQILFPFAQGVDGLVDPGRILTVIAAKFYFAIWCTFVPSMMLKALFGRTFDGSWYDFLVQLQLGYECLYDGERWGEYGLSDTITGAKSYNDRGDKYYPPGFWDEGPGDQDDDDDDKDNDDK
jgi:hypothetical protein